MMIVYIKKELDKFASLRLLHGSSKEESTMARRKEFYSKVKCSTLKKIVELYRMDLEMFGYDPGLHLKLCHYDN